MRRDPGLGHEATMGDARLPVTAWFGLGGNVGDRMANLAHALALLSQSCVSVASSSVFETPPWGDLDQPSFLNLVARGTTWLEPGSLLARVKEVERIVGRRPTRRWGPRVVDVDILSYGNLVVSMDALEIPHPRMAERAFVMIPLADLDPDWVHPATGATASVLVNALSAQEREGVVRVGPAPVFGFPESRA